MKVNFFILLTLVIAFLQSCATNVQTRYNLKIPKSKIASYENYENNSQPEIIIDQTPPEITSPPSLNKNYDTIEIELTNVQATPTEISRGKELLMLGDYRNALQSFISYTNRTQGNDYYYWLARFYIAECFYQMNYYEQAIKELTELFYYDELPKEIKVKVLVQLSEIYCKTNEKEKSKYYFELYKTYSPEETSIDQFRCK